MRAVAFSADHSLQVVDVAEPDLQPDEVRVSVRFCGICGSDLHMQEYAPAGVVPGHEFTGTIVEAGPAVTGWAVGDRVTANPFDACTSCGNCTSGYPELCPTGTKRGVGLMGYYGAYAETVAVPQASLYRLPDSVSDRDGALAEPLAVGLHGVGLSQAAASETAVVLGAGPIGTMTALGLRARGLEKIIVVEPIEVRRETIRRLGFEVSEVEGQDDNVRDHLGGPARLAFDCTGVPEGIGNAISMVGAGGRVTVIGIPFLASTLSVVQLNMREAYVRGSMAYNDADWRQAIDLLASGAIPADDIITSVTPISAANQWFTDLTSGATKQIKVLLQP
jgi:2-desacetyl-2-hydroxyethyl bacteriochlorophyllide A dehydrogenase